MKYEILVQTEKKEVIYIILKFVCGYFLGFNSKTLWIQFQDQLKDLLSPPRWGQEIILRIILTISWIIWRKNASFFLRAP